MEEKPLHAWMSLGRLLRQWPSWPASLFTVIGLWQFLAAVVPKAELPEITFVTIPWWGWLLAALFLYMVSAAKVLGESLERVEEVLKKSQDMHTTLTALKDNVHGMFLLHPILVRYAYLNVSLEHLAGLNRGLDNWWATLKSQMATKVGMEPDRYKHVLNEAKDSLANLQKFSDERHFGDVKFHAHPKYDENPNAHVDGEDPIPEERKMEFRRWYHTYQNAKPLIDRTRTKIEGQLEMLNRKLQELGKNG